jgi:quinone-modifying oxidoreductase, subunit QmoA
MTAASAAGQAGAILVVGGGMAGITAAIESAELGREVFLVERSPSLGGRVAGMKHYFPKLCPPYCGLEINYRRIKENPSITVLTSAEVVAITGARGDFAVTVTVRPRFVRDEARDPVGPYAALDRTVANAFDYGLSKRRAVQVPHELAFPYRAVVDEAALLDPALKEQVASLPGVDLTQQPQTLTLRVGTIIWATGWHPYDAAAIGYLKYAEYADVVTSLELERLAAPNGPTAGALTRPSDGRPARRVAFVQCAGSRDARHLPYCSAVCCMASLKQATYVRAADPEAEVWIFYIDIRANKYESFYRKVQGDPKVHFIKGKPGGVERDAASGDLVVLAEDAASGQLARVPVDLVVLATGIVPQTRTEKVPYEGLAYDEHGFLISAPLATGIFAAGCVKRPADVAASVQDATGASLRAARI